MYRGGRPNQVAAVMNRISAIIASAGVWPSRLVPLQVPGRRTGRRISFPLVLAWYEGERYLVSMLGPRTAWVANVRANNGQAVLSNGRLERVRLVEVDAGGRAPILRRYLQVAPGARPHIPVDRRAPLTEFEGIAERYPVFRVHSELGCRARV
jgi:hypothetical protein